MAPATANDRRSGPRHLLDEPEASFAYLGLRDIDETICQSLEALELEALDSSDVVVHQARLRSQGQGFLQVPRLDTLAVGEVGDRTRHTQRAMLAANAQ